MYFEEPEKTNTEETLNQAFKRAVALGLNEVVVASTTGDTALKAVEIFDDGFSHPKQVLKYEI